MSLYKIQLNLSLTIPAEIHGVRATYSVIQSAIITNPFQSSPFSLLMLSSPSPFLSNSPFSYHTPLPMLPHPKGPYSENFNLYISSIVNPTVMSTDLVQRYPQVLVSTFNLLKACNHCLTGLFHIFQHEVQVPILQNIFHS